MIASKEIKKPKSICMNATVCSIKDTSPHLRRISLQHELLKGIGPLAPGVHFKIFISPIKALMAVLPDLSSGRPTWHDEKTKPYVRTYTIRNLDRSTGIMDVEFVLHGDSGPASAWAEKASVGDYLGIGLRPSGEIPEWADWNLLAGDETAIPAIAAILEALPASATGFAFLEVDNEADIFPVNTNSAVEIRWLLRNGTLPEHSDLILNAIKGLTLPSPTLKSRYVWVAGEDNMVRAMRQYSSEELDLGRHELHATVYWTAGLSKDEDR